MAEVLLTGYPSFLARKLCRRLIAAGDTVQLLVRHRHKDEAARFLRGCAGPGRATPLVGDVVLMDLGLAGPEVRRLLRSVEQIYHLASVASKAESPELAHRVNVEGTRSVVELALGAERLNRFSFLSTAFVAGTRSGVVLEEELDRGQKFRSVFEQTKFEAEKVVRRASADMPVSIFRPSLLVGDTQTGETDTTNDPYAMMVAFLNVPLDVSVPLPGRGDCPLNLVPVDFVVDAICTLAKDPRAVGLTFHLTDPNPLPARRVLELLADYGQRRRPKGAIPAPLARRLFALPGLRRLGPPAAVVDHFDQLVIYNCKNTVELLAGTPTRCPPFESYVGSLVAALQKMRGRRQEGYRG